MGLDTSGILFYGILLDENLQVPWAEPEFEFEWEDCYLARIGFVEPPPESDRSWDRETHSRWYEEKYQLWKERRKAALSAASCSVDAYGMVSSEPCYYVALDAAHYEGSDRPPLELNPSQLQIPEDADETLRRFCETLGLPFQQPRWYLTGLYG